MKPNDASIGSQRNCASSRRPGGGPPSSTRFKPCGGVSFITAVGLVAELGDLTRFRHPRELMAYLGLVPSESSSGPSVRRGGITKAGNPHVRRLLAESAWAYQGIPRSVGSSGIAKKDSQRSCARSRGPAPLRLTGRCRRLVARGKAKPTVATAIAHELTGFIWAIAQEVAPAPR